MKNFIRVLVGFSILSTGFEIIAQDSLSHDNIFPKGISLGYGIGNYAVTDKYISKEKYSGSLPFYEISWIKPHTNYIYHLSINYQNSAKIKNNNVSTDIYQFSINQGFNYALPKFTLFDKEAYTYLGPSTELFFYYNQQNIAVSGFDYAQSYAMLISGSINFHLYYLLTKDFNIEGSLGFSIISLGFRMVDMEETDDSPVKILTLFSGTNLNIKLGIRYFMLNNLSLKASYLFHFTRISSWNPLLAASDNIVFTMTYGF